MEGNKKKKRKLKKGGLILILALLALIIIGILTLIIFKNIEQKEIKKYFSKTVTLKKKSTIYYKNSKIGTNLEELKLELEKINGKLFKVKNTDYYVYYKDVKKDKEIKDKKVTSNYVLFNKNIRSNKKVDLYKDDKKIITVKNINSPIESMDKDNYYISFLNQ